MIPKIVAYSAVYSIALAACFKAVEHVKDKHLAR